MTFTLYHKIKIVRRVMKATVCYPILSFCPPSLKIWSLHPAILRSWRNSTNGLSFLSRSDWIMHLSWRKWKSTSRREWKQGYDGGALLLGDQLSHFQLPFGKVSCRKGWWGLLRSTCNRVEGFCWSKTFFHDFQNWTSETLFLFSTQCIFFWN